MSKHLENTGLNSHPTNYSNNPIPWRTRGLKPGEILPGDGKIFTIAHPPRILSLAKLVPCK